MQTLRWGIVSTGNIAGVFASAFAAAPGNALAAVASRTQEKAERFAQEHGVPRAYGSYEAMAADPSIDAVYIATPMSRHAADAALFLQAGKHVLCEKAVTCDAAELEALLRLAREKGRFFMEAMWMRCLPVFRQAQAWVRAGRIGRVEAVKAELSIMPRVDPAHRLFSPALGGGALLDVGTYAVHFLCAFLGSCPQQVIAAGRPGPTGVDFDDVILLRYPGAFGFASVGFSAPGGNGAAVLGERGRILFPGSFLSAQEAVLVDAAGAEVERFHEPFRANGYEYELSEARDCILAGKRESALVPAEASLGVMRILDACRAQCGLGEPKARGHI